MRCDAIRQPKSPSEIKTPRRALQLCSDVTDRSSRAGGPAGCQPGAVEHRGRRSTVARATWAAPPVPQVGRRADQRRFPEPAALAPGPRHVGESRALTGAARRSNGWQRLVDRVTINGAAPRPCPTPLPTHTTSSARSRSAPIPMAMSDTGSSFAQWAALYHHHHDATGPAAVLPDDAAADVGVGSGIGIGTTAAVASPTSGVSSGGGSPTKAGGNQHHQQQVLHGVEGPRIGKPAAARRRSRASRRAPVTLLNTDTANFRAMVQQFTGIPAPPAGAFGVGAPVINFAADYGFPPSSAVMSFDHQLHRSHSHPAAPLQEQLRRQQQQYTGASSSPFGYSNGGLLQGGGGDVFASHGGFAASAEDRMLLQSFQAAQMPHMPPVSAAANTSTNGFFA